MRSRRVRSYRDEPSAVAAVVRELAARSDVAVILLTGGTGVAPRDQTPEAVAALFTKELPGFGELFRMLSYQEIGAAAMLSRALRRDDRSHRRLLDAGVDGRGAAGDGAADPPRTGPSGEASSEVVAGSTPATLPIFSRLNPSRAVLSRRLSPQRPRYSVILQRSERILLCPMSRVRYSSAALARRPGQSWLSAERGVAAFANGFAFISRAQGAGRATFIITRHDDRPRRRRLDVPQRRRARSAGR